MALLVAAVAFGSDAPEFTISLKDHRFSPAELQVPAGQRVKLIVRNLDAPAAEFESYELVREKVVKGHAEIVVYIGPLTARSYHYYDDFDHDATGVITAK